MPSLVEIRPGGSAEEDENVKVYDNAIANDKMEKF